MRTGCSPDARRQRHALRAAWRLRRRSRRVINLTAILIPGISNVVRILTSRGKRIMGNEHFYLRCTIVGDPERLTGLGNLSSNLLGGSDRKDVRLSQGQRNRVNHPILQVVNPSIHESGQCWAVVGLVDSSRHS